MADIRINALATTAASTASDDFLAVDGSSQGTRKLNAYSPTFGGNLTVSGTGDFSGTITSTTTNSSGTQVTALSTGSSSSSGGAFALLGSRDGAALANGDRLGGLLFNGSTGASTNENSVALFAYANEAWSSGVAGAKLNIDIAANGGSARTTALSLTSSAATLAGNLLVGTTADNGNKLQVSGTFSAITGDGTGAKVSYVQGGTTAGDYGIFNIQNGGTVKGRLVADASYADFRLDTGGSASGGFVFKTGASYTTALTLDSSQNATFAGSIAINNTVQTAVAVASTHKVTISIGGSTYYLLATNV